MGAQETFVQNVNGGNWVSAADQLNGSAMYDILVFLTALGSNGAISANNISGILRNRGWFGAAQRIEWAGEVIRTRRIPSPPPGLPADQVTDAEQFLAGKTSKADSVQRSFSIEISSPFRSGWTQELGGPKSGGHTGPEWYIEYGMDLGVKEGTEVRAAFDGYVCRPVIFKPRSKDNPKEYGKQLFVRAHGNKMGGFYTHFVNGPDFSVGAEITRGTILGYTLGDHLHLALVEIIGPPSQRILGTLPIPKDRYKGVNIFRHFVEMKDSAATKSVTFKQDGSAPVVT